MAEQVVRLIGGAAIDCCVDDGDNIVLGDIGDRPSPPSRYKLAPEFPFDHVGLASFFHVALDELFANGSKGIFLLPLFGKFLFFLFGPGIDLLLKLG